MLFAWDEEEGRMRKRRRRRSIKNYHSGTQNWSQFQSKCTGSFLPVCISNGFISLV
jgi:hypothetical protein